MENHQKKVFPMNSLPLGFVKKALASPRCEKVKALLLFLRQVKVWKILVRGVGSVFKYVWLFPSFHLM